MSVLAWILLGLIAGFVASKIVNREGQGFLLDIFGHRRDRHHRLQSLQHVRRSCGRDRTALALPRVCRPSIR